MGRYSDNFAAAGVVSMDQVARLGLNQLVELGITLVGHQKKINNSIQVIVIVITYSELKFILCTCTFLSSDYLQAIRAQLSVNVSEGFLV